jgi:hypothetical protein
MSRVAPIHLGLDVHKDTISVGILPANQQVPHVERISHDEASIRRLVGRLGNPRMLRVCHEAGPIGFELACLLHWSSPTGEHQEKAITMRHTAGRAAVAIAAAACFTARVLMW